MFRLIVIFLLPAAAFGKLDMGIESFKAQDKTFSYQRQRTAFGGTVITVSAECIGTLHGILVYSLLGCPTGNETDMGRSKWDVTKKDAKCHGGPESFGLNLNATGVYLINITLQADSLDNVTLKFGTKMNYLSPKDYPLFVFYAVMCVVYAVYALVWLLLCCCYWRELLRIQFWIGGVIFLGMLEKAMFVGEYDAIRRYGLTTGSMLIAAEVVSSMKRTLSRMLVIIVSLGFGIVKPRLGAALHKVTLVGLLFFIISTADGVVRTNDEEYPKRLVAVFRFLLSITDAVIFLWIFYSVVKTITLLTLRKNLVKLSLYRHFRNVLIFSVLASVAFMVALYFKNYFVNRKCPWENTIDEAWWEEAFWSLLFSIILLAIIVLWRPSANNQRYAYSPLQDIDDEDLDHLTECTNEGLGVTKRGNEVTDNGKKSTNNEEDDLKWVEENIPKSIIDSALSNLVESDEEINQKKFEISKML